MPSWPPACGTFLLALLALALLAGTSHAGTPAAFGEARFELPEGWSGGPRGEALWAAERRFGTEGGAIIQVVRPVAGNDAPAAAARFAASLPELADRRPMRRGDGVTTNGHRLAFEERCCGTRGSATIGVTSVAIADGRATHLLLLATVGLRREAARTARADFDALVRSYRPRESDRPFELRPPPGAGGLEGVFTHLDTGIRPNAFGGTDFYAEIEVLVLDPSGLFGRALPPGGEPLAEHCARAPTGCGTYRVSGSVIELREATRDFGLLRVTSEPLAREGGDLRIGRTAHRRVEPFPPGATLEGTWRYTYASSGSGAFSSGSVAVERTLTLSRDGRFARTGWSGASSTNETGGGRTGVTVGGARPTATGRYVLEGYRLTLLRDDGGREDMPVMRPDPGSEALLVIGGANYLRRDGAGQARGPSGGGKPPEASGLPESPPGGRKG
ncbi:hypothetical protein ACE7GA_22250 [Roseomonas sp. CCTCC AB2023176]|uniref:hypothetical protein n=1 Tax=Roseomonas sp. CCTCC AB2023176 TaxID=3342640 RepID=UPI0035DA152A